MSRSRRSTRRAIICTLAALLAAPGAGRAVSAGDIAKDPDRYRGQEVTVTADVAEVYDRRYFTLDEDAAPAGPDLLVLVPQMADRPVTGDDEVTVTGTVRDFVQSDLPAPDGVVTIQTRPVIVASSVRSTAGEELATPPPAQQSLEPPSEPVRETPPASLR